ncbi:hypothetical protein NDU88_008986 [Pleurodeles waltl]|uniref:Uncharacterized protein n=1 Tax=Pleurodeles waltl TaxID=8319 RepID=A0AAV7QRD3_PLEWA|nr:hypothetical protein NDU88_008986 [Pleurodeles waltl]
MAGGTPLVRSAVPIISYRDPGCQTAVHPRNRKWQCPDDAGGSLRLERGVGPGRVGATSAHAAGPMRHLPAGAATFRPQIGWLECVGGS